MMKDDAGLGLTLSGLSIYDVFPSYNPFYESMTDEPRVIEPIVYQEPKTPPNQPWTLF